MWVAVIVDRNCLVCLYKVFRISDGRDNWMIVVEILQNDQCLFRFDDGRGHWMIVVEFVKNDQCVFRVFLMSFVSFGWYPIIYGALHLYKFSNLTGSAFAFWNVHTFANVCLFISDECLFFYKRMSVHVWRIRMLCPMKFRSCHEFLFDAVSCACQINPNSCQMTSVHFKWICAFQTALCACLRNPFYFKWIS